MVRFAKNYRAHIVREWSAHYLNYDKLKAALHKKESVVANIVKITEDIRNPFFESLPTDEEKQVGKPTQSTTMDLEMQCKPTRRINNKQKYCCDHQEFTSVFKAEVNQIDSFYLDRLNELIQQLKYQLRIVNTTNNVSNVKESKEEKKRRKDREESIKRALTILYTRCEQLENYCTLNIIGCIKILKKHDKLKSPEEANLYPALMHAVVYCSSFGEEHNRLTRVMNDCVMLYGRVCCNGDLVEAKGKLKMAKGEEDPAKLWYLGLRIGAVLVLVIWFGWDCIVDPGDGATLWNDPAIYLYSFIGNLIIYNWLWGVSVFMWERHYVNYVYLLDLASHHTPTAEQIFTQCSTLSIVYLVNFLLYYKARRGHLYYVTVEPHVFPVIMALITATYLCYSLIRNAKSYRLFNINVVIHILTAPLSPVTLRDNFAADYLTSCVKVFSNFAFGTCYLLSGSYRDSNTSLHNFGACNSADMAIATGILALAPLWLRFCQCLRRVYDSSSGNEFKFLQWPHSYNGIKYLLSMVVVGMGLMHPLTEVHESAENIAVIFYRCMFIFICVVSTLYSFYWDVVMDWGLMQITPTMYNITRHKYPQHVFLRSKLMYKNENLYYAAIVADFLLRCLWTVSLIPQGTSGPFGYSLNDQLGPFLATFELSRRCIWSWLKMECEHINHSDGWSKRNIDEDEDVIAADTVALHFDRADSSNDKSIKTMGVKQAVCQGLAGCAMLGLVTIIVLYW